MKKFTPVVVFDEDLQIEACRFFQPFPNHFHEHYVIGLVEEGSRSFSCRNKEYILQKGDIMLLNPGDNHSCAREGEGPLDYRGFNISREVMLELVEEEGGQERNCPEFLRNVVCHEEAAEYFRRLHSLLLEGRGEPEEKEELLLLMVSCLIQKYGTIPGRRARECRAEIERACRFMEQHFAERITLNRICGCTGLSKSTLLRAFTKEKGVTPYRYLEAVRVNRAKELLEEGVPPGEAAITTGFSDQSHFTNYFTRFIGLAPGAYRDSVQDKKKSKRKT